MGDDIYKISLEIKTYAFSFFSFLPGADQLGF